MSDENRRVFLPYTRVVKRTDVRPASSLTLWEKYNAWRSTPHGEEVFQLCAELTARLQQRGFKRYGIHGIIETARWHHSIKHGPDADGFKIANSHAPYLAREIWSRQIVSWGFFTFNELRSLRHRKRVSSEWPEYLVQTMGAVVEEYGGEG